MTRLITVGQLTERFSVCSETISRWVKDEKMGFPKPVKLNGRPMGRRFWREDEIENWLSRVTSDVTCEHEKAR